MLQDFKINLRIDDKLKEYLGAEGWEDAGSKQVLNQKRKQ